MASFFLYVTVVIVVIVVVVIAVFVAVVVVVVACQVHCSLHSCFTRLCSFLYIFYCISSLYAVTLFLTQWAFQVGFSSLL